MTRAGHGLFGETEEASIDDADVVRAAQYALSQAYDMKDRTAKNAYNSNVRSYKLVHATKQLVNGLKCEFTMEITSPNDYCSVRQFAVWERALPEGSFLVENYILEVPCGSTFRA